MACETVSEWPSILSVERCGRRRMVTTLSTKSIESFQDSMAVGSRPWDQLRALTSSKLLSPPTEPGIFNNSAGSRPISLRHPSKRSLDSTCFRAPSMWIRNSVGSMPWRRHRLVSSRAGDWGHSLKEIYSSAPLAQLFSTVFFFASSLLPTASIFLLPILAWPLVSPITQINLIKPKARV